MLNKEKLMIDLLNITSVPNNFKSFIKQVYQKEWMQNINKKKSQNSYFRAKISQKEEKQPALVD